jgi:hypothetical protein
MLVRALTFDGFVADPTWVYRWRDQAWGAKGVAHFHGADHPFNSCRIVMSHILDRLEIEEALRDAWCAEHGDEPVIHEFRGTWPRSIPAAVRERREFRVTVRSMWSLHPLGSAVRLVGIA